MYTDIKEALLELKRRQAIPGVTEKVSSYLNNDIPAPLTNTVISAVLFRNLFTPDYELEVFEQIAKANQLEPVLFEYTHDKFVAVNEDKYALGKLYFYLGTTGSTTSNMYARKVVDFNSAEGKQISELQTISGENFVHFHHRILDMYSPSSSKNIYEISKWLKEHGGNAKEYYKAFLALFITHGILFDNFRTTGAEGAFSENVFKPAFQIVEDHFGMKPLICSLQAPEDEDNPKWWGYDKSRMEGILEAIDKV